jgi:hypothetical protein
MAEIAENGEMRKNEGKAIVGTFPEKSIFA